MVSQHLHGLRSLRPWAFRRARCAVQCRNISQGYVEKLREAKAEWARRKVDVENGTRKHVIDVIEERGLIKDMAGRPDLVRKVVLENRVGAYVGIDPTGESLHIGHLLPLIPLMWMHFHGMRTYTLIGGATARFGDPTDRLKSREVMKNSDVALNMAKIQHQLKKVWDNAKNMGRNYGYEGMWGGEIHLRNNNEWFNKLPMYEFLKRLGRYIRIGPLLSRDTVKRKMEQGDGLSFSELAYPLMQGWDWWHLYSVLHVQCQVGGSDQFGNIVTGIDCVKTCRAAETDPQLTIPDHWTKEPFGFTTPLVTDAAGQKLGKSDSNASNIWLDITKTKAYDLYGYFVGRSDEEVERLLKLYTFIPLEHISQIMEHHALDPPKRVAQHVLAFEVVSLVHSPQVALRERVQHQFVHGKDPITLPAGIITSDQNVSRTDLNEEDGLHMDLQHATREKIQLPESLVLDESLNKLFFACGLASSTTEAHRFIKEGGCYIGAQPGKDKGALIPGFLDWTPAKLWKKGELSKFLIDGNTLIVRRGKHNVRIIETVDDETWKKSGKTYPGQPYTGRMRLLKEALKEAKADGTTLDFESSELTKSVPNNSDIKFPEGPRGKPIKTWNDFERTRGKTRYGRRG